MVASLHVEVRPNEPFAGSELPSELHRCVHHCSMWDSLHLEVCQTLAAAGVEVDHDTDDGGVLELGEEGHHHSNHCWCCACCCSTPLVAVVHRGTAAHNCLFQEIGS